MRFKVKDLMISVAPGGCYFRTRICLRPTFCNPFTCPGNTIICYRQPTICWNQSPCPANTCGFISPCGVISPCGHISPCGFETPCPGFTEEPCGIASPFEGPIVLERFEDIEVLRKELREVEAALGDLDERAFATESAEDLDLLEEKLQEALEEVRSKKKSK